MIRRRSEINSSFEMNYLKGFDVEDNGFQAPAERFRSENCCR
jgi:hypothetical protein